MNNALPLDFNIRLTDLPAGEFVRAQLAVTYMNLTAEAREYHSQFTSTNEIEDSDTSVVLNQKVNTTAPRW